MKTKDYLRQLARKNAKINALIERQCRYEELASRGVAVYRHTPRGGSRRVSSVEDYTCKIVDLKREIDRRIDEYVDLTHSIEAVIDSVRDDRYRDILRFRYVNEWTWERIAAEMGYSRDWVWHLHGQALLVVEKIRQTKTVSDVI